MMLLALYAELLGWSAGMQQILMLGDLNETLTQWDREPQPAPRAGGIGAAAASSPLHTLVADGFKDVFRHLHPDSAREPGFTHVLDGARPSRSRIDYIWSRNISAASLFQCETDASLRALTHHRLLWAELLLQLLFFFNCDGSSIPQDKATQNMLQVPISRRAPQKRAKGVWSAEVKQQSKSLLLSAESEATQ